MIGLSDWKKGHTLILHCAPVYWFALEAPFAGKHHHLRVGD